MTTTTTTDTTTTPRTYTLDEIKTVIANQIATEAQYGADEQTIGLLTEVTGDILHLLSGRYIVNGVRF